MRIHRLMALVLGGAVLAALAGTASAHYKSGDPDSPSSTWYFLGSTYKKDTYERKDPVNFMFYGLSDTSSYTRDRIETHMRDDWNTHLVGGRRWRKDSDTNFYCKDDQRMYWVSSREDPNDLTDWHGSTSRLPGYCGNQHHARFWDDHEHARWTTGHGRQDQWVVGGIHHERVKYAVVVPTGHKIDRDWDQVRREMVRAMSRHCADAAWRYHPGADDVYQHYTNSGYIARIALHHKADGGCTGQ